jgi:hypothetical protein
VTLVLVINSKLLIINIINFTIKNKFCGKKNFFVMKKKAMRLDLGFGMGWDGNPIPFIWAASIVT